MPTHAAIENALVVAVKAASGYSTGSVFWSGQGKTIPSGDYIELRLGDLIEERTAVPAQTRTYSSTPVGSEITHTYRMAAQFTLSIQVFTSSVVGNSCARAIASKIRDNLALSTIREALIAAGVGMLSSGAAKGLPSLKGSRFEGRAIVEPRFNVINTVTETSTYIETLGPVDGP